MSERPFFSVIIPCYNSKPERIKELLDTVVNGGCPKETEIVISDDRSTDKTFLDTVKEYEDKFFEITITEVPDKNEDGTELIHCPGNTRQNGVNVAKGEWVTFIDHDDIFGDDAFKIVKDGIRKSGEQHYVCSNIIQLDPKTGEEIKEIHAFNWMHGKFYNLDNFWNKYGIKFKTNLFGNEDITVSAKVNCIINKLNKGKVDDPLNIPTFWIEEFIYIWRSWEDSTSNISYNDKNYMEVYFHDYIDGVLGTYIDDYNELKEKGELEEFDIKFHKMMQTDLILYMYFYIQSFKFNHINDLDPNIECKAKTHIKNYYKRFDTTSIDLYEYIDNFYEERGRWYNDILINAKRAVGPFIEVDSFFDFISK